MQKYLEQQVTSIVFRDPVPAGGTIEERIAAAQKE
jgi:hypothetical protein